MMVKHLAPLVEEITVMHCGYPNESPASDSDVLDPLVHPLKCYVIGSSLKTIIFSRPLCAGHRKEYSLNLYTIRFAA